MPRELVAEHRAQLVLRGDDGDLRAGIGERGEQSSARAGSAASFIITSACASRSQKKLPQMPCTDGGAPVTIDRLFGLVNDGTTQSAVRQVPRSRSDCEPGRGAGADRLVDVVGLAAVDAHDDQRARAGQR